MQPYFVLDGNVAAFLAAKDHMTVFYDPLVDDPGGIITAGQGNSTGRQISLHEGDKVPACLSSRCFARSSSTTAPAAGASSPASSQKPSVDSGRGVRQERFGCWLLVIEDEPKLRSVLTRGLEQNGSRRHGFIGCSPRFDLRKFTDYAVLIVDWRLPGMSGVDFVRHLRRRKDNAAVLMLTARDAPADRISGLDAGADDYLVKPFDFGELLARVRALQRRPGSSDGRELRWAPMLDPQTRQVRSGDEILHLSPTEFRILELLMLRSPNVVDRSLIAQHAWRDETDPLGSNAIDARVARLRAKLATSGAQIVTVRGAGYRLADT